MAALRENLQLPWTVTLGLQGNRDWQKFPLGSMTNPRPKKNSDLVNLVELFVFFGAYWRYSILRGWDGIDIDWMFFWGLFLFKDKKPSVRFRSRNIQFPSDMWAQCPSLAAPVVTPKFTIWRCFFVCQLARPKSFALKPGHLGRDSMSTSGLATALSKCTTNFLASYRTSDEIHVNWCLSPSNCIDIVRTRPGKRLQKTMENHQHFLWVIHGKIQKMPQKFRCDCQRSKYWRVCTIPIQM